jgi:hypothetical protein
MPPGQANPDNRATGIRMRILPLTTRSFKPGSAIEIPVLFEGRFIRVELDKDTILDLMQAPALTRDVVDEFLTRYRTNIDLAIEAHVYAQGVPLDRHLVISIRDFNVREPL